MAEDTSAHTLDDLVARTTGAQPWRKVFHAATAVFMAAGLALLQSPSQAAILTLTAIVVALLTADIVRLRHRGANQLFFRVFGKLASPREARRIASSTWYAVGVLIVAALFPRPVAISGVLVLGLADPAASYVGQKLGRRPFLGGTLEGSLVFFATSTAVLALRHTWPIALLASVVATLAERGSWPLDDNLTIPVVSAGAVAALGLLL